MIMPVSDGVGVCTQILQCPPNPCLLYSASTKLTSLLPCGYPWINLGKTEVGLQRISSSLKSYS